uniref:Tr-type G domain-containing protein n=5 Tax=Meloidogyne TaxID=189290 RepID=A0A6V7VZ92_MELEN|nr:unnamed protein product [Meloidogyne enterolobii]
MENTKTTIVVIGHVDAGKSTTISHLIYKLGKYPLKTTMDFKEATGITDPKKLVETICGDCAVLIVDCGTVIDKVDQMYYNMGAMHIAKMNNVKQLIVAFNKMDETEFSEVRFKIIKSEIIEYMEKKNSYKPATVAFVPISGLAGDNIMKPSERMTWFKGWNIKKKEGIINGMTLLEALKTIKDI